MQYIELTMGEVTGSLEGLREFLRSEAADAKNDEDKLKEGESCSFELQIRLSASEDASGARLELWYLDDCLKPVFLAQGEIEPKAVKAAGETLVQYHASTDEIASDVWDREAASGAKA